MTINLSGTGISSTYPDITVTPGSLNFGSVNVGSTSDQIITIRNDGSANLTIGTISSPASPFGKIVDNCSGHVLAPSQSCTVSYRFSPTSVGTFNSNSSIPSNDPDENQVTITLSGTGSVVSETVSTPSTLTGPTSGNIGVNYAYSTGGSSSNLGHTVEYQFDWGDGTYSVWSTSTSASKSWSSINIYLVRSRARCKDHIPAVSNWYSGLSVTISSSVETVSTPSNPAGPSNGIPGVSYTYVTGGSSSILGHNVQYLFDWGNGTNSGWLPVGTTNATKSWPSAGTYQVKCQARCASHTSIISSWSGILSVTITSSSETISTPSRPAGTVNGSIGISYNYFTWASSSLGHLLEYRFDWNDGTFSNWSSFENASKAWNSSGTYAVRAQARCAADTWIVSDWSNALYANISTIQKPNLTPIQLSGWSDKIVVSKSPDSYIDSIPLYSTDTLYAHFAWGNDGPVAPPGACRIEFYVDGVLKYSTTDKTEPSSNAYSGIVIGRLSAGPHTLRIIVDPQNTISEINEEDNEYIKTISVQQAEPPDVASVEHVILIIVDGLRKDTLYNALDDRNQNRFRTLKEVFRQNPHIQFDNAYTVFPSVTFVANASLVTGLYPDGHGIPGNTWYDRNSGKHRYYTDLTVYGLFDDIYKVYSEEELAVKDLEDDVKTIYDYLIEYEKSSTVHFHMFGRKKKDNSALWNWYKPNSWDLLLYVTGKAEALLGNVEKFKMFMERYDENAMFDAATEIEESGTLPNLLTLYFAGNDSVSHEMGVKNQTNYLTEVIDPLLCKFVNGTKECGDMLRRSEYDLSSNQIREYSMDFAGLKNIRNGGMSLYDRTVFIILSDHGQSDVKKAGSKDYLDSFLAKNGGMAQIYVQNREWIDDWEKPPRFLEDVVPIAETYWKNRNKWKIKDVLVRNSEQSQEWGSKYLLYKGGGRTYPLDYSQELLERINRLSSKRSGDIVIISRPKYSFGSDKADHGSIFEEDSHVPLIFSGKPLGNAMKTDDSIQNIINVAPTITKLLGITMQDIEGKEISQVLESIKFDYE